MNITTSGILTTLARRLCASCVLLLRKAIFSRAKSQTVSARTHVKNRVTTKHSHKISEHLTDARKTRLNLTLTWTFPFN